MGFVWSMYGLSLIHIYFETNIALLGLKSRSKQEEFAKTVRRELDNTDISMIQAQTGIGKTYGYLLPLLAQALSLIHI